MKTHPRSARTAGGPGGFTLVELMAAMFITLILSSIVVMVYNTSMQSYYRTERQLRTLAAFRSTTDRLERELHSIVVKAGLYPAPVYFLSGGVASTGFEVAFWDTRAKYIHGDAWVNSSSYAYSSLLIGADNPVDPGELPVGIATFWTVNPDGRSIYKINFRPRYLGYYSTLDGHTIDRTEWYYNPSEERQVWANGLDDDGDDPEGEAGLRILYDDRGCLMLRKRFDSDLAWREWDGPVADGPGPNEYRDLYHGPYSRADFPPQADELDGPVVLVDDDGDGSYDRGIDNDGDGFLTDADRVDTGTVVGENFADLQFLYVYKLPENDQLNYAPWWPYDNDNDPTNANLADPKLDVVKRPMVTHIGGTVSGAGAAVKGGTPDPAETVGFDMAYFTLPMAVAARFTFEVGNERHTYEKLIYLHSSRWLKWLNP